MSASDHFTKLENMYRAAPINEFFEPEIAIKEGHAEVTIGVRTEFFHAAQAVHGSVTFKMLDEPLILPRALLYLAYSCSRHRFMSTF